jgi:recombination protein RecR
VELPEIIQKASDSMSKIPGIGGKTALRHILWLCEREPDLIKSMGANLRNLTELSKCSTCNIYCDEGICPICSSQERNNTNILCIVENISDCMAIENAGSFNGVYHLLGGVLNPLLGVGPKELNMDQLFERIRSSEIETVILAINPSIEGDATCSFIKEEIPSQISVERIGFGIPMGGNLEYLDAMTISKALENRKRI